MWKKFDDATGEEIPAGAGLDVTITIDSGLPGRPLADRSQSFLSWKSIPRDWLNGVTEDGYPITSLTVRAAADAARDGRPFGLDVAAKATASRVRGRL